MASKCSRCATTPTEIRAPASQTRPTRRRNPSSDAKPGWKVAQNATRSAFASASQPSGAERLVWIATRCIDGWCDSRVIAAVYGAWTRASPQGVKNTPSSRSCPSTHRTNRSRAAKSACSSSSRTDTFPKGQ